MKVPFPKSSAGSDVPLSGGVDEYGGVKDTKDDVYSTTGLPKGVNEYGATEDQGELGSAANKYGIKKVPGMS